MKNKIPNLFIYYVLAILFALMCTAFLFRSIEKNTLIMEERAFPYIGKYVVMGNDTLKILYYSGSWDEVILEDGKVVSIKFLEYSKILENVENPR